MQKGFESLGRHGCPNYGCMRVRVPLQTEVITTFARFCKMYVKKKQKSIYIKNEKYICECNREFNNAQSLNSHFGRCLIHRNGVPCKPRGGGGWHVSEESHKKSGLTLSLNIKNGITTPSFKGKHHSLETRQHLSDKAGECNNGFIKTKFHKVFCPFLNIEVSVQGTWELQFANRLNELEIMWQKGRTMPLTYHLDGLVKKYFPDFYLPTRNKFVEIKGYWFNSHDGRVDDKRKMLLVVENNKDVDIIILDSLQRIISFV